jgi:hypothetical protein
VAGPFRSKIFLSAYFFAAGLLLLGWLSDQPKLWGDFLQALMVGLVSKIVGGKSADFSAQFINLLPAGWILLGLAGYGAAALWWAEPRRKFLEGVEEQAGLKVVRGGGARAWRCSGG